MGSLHSILQAIGFGNNQHVYRRIPDDDLDQPECETHIVNQISEEQRHFHHSTIERIDQRYSFIWLDEHSKEFSIDTEYTKIILYKFYPQCWSFYTESDEFLNDIRHERHRNNQILLIVSGSLAEQVLPKIKNLVPIVIIYCANYNKYIHLKTSKYPNVLDVCTDYETLKNLIQRQLSSVKLDLNENVRLTSMKSLVSTIISHSEEDFNNENNRNSSTIIGNETAFFYILIVDLLKQMPPTDQSKHIWLNKCRECYHGNPKVLEQINKFSEEYKSDEAILWYIDDSFVHRLLNWAFRTDDITIWYLSRYLIIDISQQLEIIYQEQNSSQKFKLYRGQRMYMEELKSIRESVGINGLVCTTAFFSTTKNISVAQPFSGEIGDPNDDQIVSVLFEIILDSNNLERVRFIDVNQYLLKKWNKYSREEELLFNIGSIFRITNIEQDFESSKLWTIYMEATDDGTDIIQYHLDMIRTKYQNIRINLRFGRYLLDMNYLSKAESYFQMLLHELERENYKQCYEEDLVFVYNSLGELHMRATNYKQAYRHFQKAYSIRSTNKILTSFIYFGNYYKAIDNPSQAYKYYMDAFNQNDQKNPIHINRIKINLATIHSINKQYYKSLNISLEIQNSLKKIQSKYPLYSDMIISQGIIADIYLIKQNYNEAEKYYLNIFNICKQYLCLGDKQYIHWICSLTELYRQKFNDNNQYAIRFCEQQLELHRRHLSEKHLSVAYLLMKLGHIKQDIIYYQQALQILIDHDHWEYATIAQCHQFIGDYYLKNEQINQNIEKALKHYYEIRKIYIKIYPVNHQRIIEIEDFIQFNESRSLNE